MRHHDVVNASGLLSLRRLQVLAEVLKTFEPYTADALMRGWAEQLADDVWYFGPGANWYVQDAAFQRLYEAHRDGPEGEEILWELATGPSPHDCEGEFACTARVEVLEKFARYWTDYPRGRYVGDAIAMAVASLDGFLRNCMRRATPSRTRGRRGGGNTRGGTRAVPSWLWNFGPHVAALGMRFYSGEMFPSEYHQQIFIAEHGSWDRSEKIGYRVSLVRLENSRVVSYEPFAQGWLEGDEAWGRPVDLLVMPDGALLVSDDRAGVIYRISYSGE